MSEKQRKGIKEEFAQFFESPSRESLRQLLANITGEYDDLDFKSEFIKPPALAKHILGMANKLGGVICFGVKEDKQEQRLEPVGIELNDKTAFLRDLNAFLPNDKLNYEVLDFNFSETEYSKIIGKSFRVVIVEYDPKHIPFMSKKDGEGIKQKAVYIRHNASTDEADYTQLQGILNRRLETNFSSSRELSLREHFDELKEIYSLIKRGEWVDSYDLYYDDIHEQDYQFVPNSKYPKEDFDGFVARMIELKKSIIESIVRSGEFSM